MAAIMEKSMRCLKRDAAYYNGEIIFCTDQTICTPFKNVSDSNKLYDVLRDII